jgi:riboflavin biosynthesis pyrimidine reductase
VVLDPRGRLDTRRSVFTDGAAPTLWVRDEAECGSSSLPAGVEIVPLQVFGDTGFRPADVLAMLAKRGLVRVLVEGGGITVSRFLEAGALDRLHLSVAPLLLGSGRPAITLPPIETLDQAIRPPVRQFPLGEDVLFDLDLGPTKA